MPPSSNLQSEALYILVAFSLTPFMSLLSISSGGKHRSGSSEQAGRFGDSAPNPEYAFRPTFLTSRYYFAVTQRLWNLLILTLPLDWLFLLLAPLSYKSSLVATQVSSVAAVAIVFGITLWWMRDTLLDLLFALQHVQQRMAVSALWPAIVLIGLVLLSSVVEVLSRISEVNIASVLVGAIVLFGAIRSILLALRQRRAEAETLARDRTSRIERANYVMFLSSIIPPVIVRLGIAAAVISLTLARAPLWEPLAVSLLGSLALLSCQPRLDQFTFACVRCGILTSRALRAGSLCPLCIIEVRDSGFLQSSQEPLALKLLRKAETLARRASRQAGSIDTAPNADQQNAAQHTGQPSSQQTNQRVASTRAEQVESTRAEQVESSHAERVEKVLRILSAILNRKP